MGEEVEYVDEDGNVIDPSELGDYEIEEVQGPVTPVATPVPAPAQAAVAVEAQSGEGPRERKPFPKALIAVAAVGALAVGGVAFGMHAIGQKHTVEDVKAAVSSTKAAVSSAVESRVEEVEQSRTGRKILGSACRDDEIAGAQWDGDREHMPKYQLRRVGGTELPGGIRAGLASKRKGEPRELAMLALGSDRMGVYVSGPTAEVSSGRGTWQKALVSVAAQAHPAILGEGTTVGGDQDTVGACETVQEGRYLILDAGNDDQPTTVEVMKQLRQQSPNVYAVVGEELVVLELEEVDEVGGGGAPASPSPSK